MPCWLTNKEGANDGRELNEPAEEVADLTACPWAPTISVPTASWQARNTTANIDIVTRDDKPGIDIYIKPGTKKERAHPRHPQPDRPQEMVYNDFHIGEDCDVTIIAGCGIHNCGGGKPSTTASTPSTSAKTPRCAMSRSTTARATAAASNIMNPTTIVDLAEGATMEMETTQIRHGLHHAQNQRHSGRRRHA